MLVLSIHHVTHPVSRVDPIIDDAPPGLLCPCKEVGVTKHQTTTAIPLVFIKRVCIHTSLDYFLQRKAFFPKGIEHQTKNTNQFSTPQLVHHHIFVCHPPRTLNL